VRGPSAWDAKSIRSEASETSGSPHESDDEELGEDVDYDDVSVPSQTFRVKADALISMVSLNRCWRS
jgi:hypothetical protein